MKTDKLWDLIDAAEDGATPAEIVAAEVQLHDVHASDLQARVADFHRACGLPVASEPTVGTPEQRELRFRLMLEEVFEWGRAANLYVWSESGDEVEGVRNLTIEHGSGTPDLVAMTHELGDVQYVVSGTAVELGLPVNEAVTQEIHPANMRKVGPDGKVVMVNGKVCKPEGWVPADVAKVLKSK